MIRALTIAIYLALGAAAAVVTLVARRKPEAVAPPSRLMDRILRDRGVRLTLFVFWWWLGWHFLMAT